MMVSMAPQKKYESARPLTFHFIQHITQPSLARANCSSVDEHILHLLGGRPGVEYCSGHHFVDGAHVAAPFLFRVVRRLPRAWPRAHLVALFAIGTEIRAVQIISLLHLLHHSQTPRGTAPRVLLDHIPLELVHPVQIHQHNARRERASRLCIGSPARHV